MVLFFPAVSLNPDEREREILSAVSLWQQTACHLSGLIHWNRSQVTNISLVELWLTKVSLCNIFKWKWLTKKLNSLSDDFCVDSSGSDCLDSPDPFTTPATPDPENSYQCLKWSSFKTDERCSLFDDSSQKLWVLLAVDCIKLYEVVFWN